MIHIALVEDDAKDRRTICEYAGRYCAENGETLRITEFENASVFLTNYTPIYDIIFMDIQMPLLDGMQAAKQLRQVDENVPLVFITNMSNFAVRGYAVNALDFVVKPVVYLSFSTMFARAVQAAKARTDEIMLRTTKGSVRIRLDSISYVESSGHQVTYHTDKGDLKVWETLKEQENRLPPGRFARCSNYCLVNMKYIDGVKGSSISVGGTEIAVTRTQKKEFLDRLLRYYGNHF